jgi:hypothetical protein
MIFFSRWRKKKSDQKPDPKPEPLKFRIVELPKQHKINYLDPQVKTPLGWESLRNSPSNLCDTVEEARWTIKAYKEALKYKNMNPIIHEVTDL